MTFREGYDKRCDEAVVAFTQENRDRENITTRVTIKVDRCFFSESMWACYFQESKRRVFSTWQKEAESKEDLRSGSSIQNVADDIVN
jgi:hypothetical protein